MAPYTIGKRDRSQLLLALPVLAAFVVAALALSACGRGSQGSYPSKNVTLMVWAAPGSSSDIYGRTLGRVTEKYLGKPIVVENKTGGAGLVAMKEIKGGAADGYTILGNTASLVTVLNGKDAGDVKLDDFDYLARIQLDPNILAVPASSPYKTFEAFIAEAKKNPEKLKVAGFESGGYHQVTLTKAMSRGGFKVTWVPYKGAGDAVTAAMGEHVDAVFSNPQAMKGAFESKKLIPLATTAGSRLATFPDVPTFKEKGVDMDDYQWRGLMAKKGTPKEAIDTFLAAVQKGMKETEWQNYMKSSNLMDGFLAGDDYKKQVQKEFDDAGKAMTQLGLK